MSLPKSTQWQIANGLLYPPAKRKIVTKITFDRSKGLYKKCIGKKRGDDGQLRPRIFWLGSVYHEALKRAQIYTDVWDELCSWPRDAWTPEFEQQAEESIKGAERWARLVADETAKRIAATLDDGNEMLQFANRASPPITDVPAVSHILPPAPIPRPTEIADGKAKSTSMLHPALDEYVKAMKAKALSPTYKARLSETIEDLKFYRADVPLAVVDRVWLEELTDFIKSRPKARRRSRQTKKFEPLAPATVKTQLQHWRQAFDWIDRASDSDRFGHWEAPKRMNDLFSVDLNKIRTKVERDRAADGPVQLSLDEIKKLVHAGSDRQRMLMLLAVFAGMGQTELRHCRRDEFDLDNAIFKHRRNKTGQGGEWWLPAELIALLRGYFNEVEPLDDGSAFSTRERQPLVTDTSDSVRQMFEDVRNAAEIDRPGVTFYAFRRFLGDRAKRAGGAELRDAALAHAATTVGDRHYSNFRDYSKVKTLGQDLHADLKAAGVFDWPVEPSTKAT